MLILYVVYYAENSELKCKFFDTVFEAEDFVNNKGIKSYLLQATQCDDDYSYPRYTNLIDKSNT